MKINKYTIGTGDDHLKIGDVFFLHKNCFIKVISKKEAIIKKLKNEPNIFKVIDREEVNTLDRPGYLCECLTTTDKYGDYE